jgi:hypothetical protein
MGLSIPAIPPERSSQAVRVISLQKLAKKSQNYRGTPVYSSSCRESSEHQNTREYDMNEVEITGPATIVGTTTNNGTTENIWSVPAVINGQAGIVTVYADQNTDLNAPDTMAALVEFLENDPDAGDLEGIGANDPGTDQGDTGDSIFVDDDGGTAVATNDGDDSSDSA